MVEYTYYNIDELSEQDSVLRIMEKHQMELHKEIYGFFWNNEFIILENLTRIYENNDLDSIPEHIKQSYLAMNQINDILNIDNNINIYNFNGEYIKYYSQLFNRNMKLSHTFQDCMKLFINMRTSDMQLLSQDNKSTEILFSIITDYISRNLIFSINKFPHTKILFEHIKKDIKELEYYKFVKKSKYYISSITVLKKIIQQFINQEDWLKFFIMNSLKKNQENYYSFKHDINYQNEFFIAMTPVLLDWFHDNIGSILWEYCCSVWEKEIYSEYEKLQTKSILDIDKKNKENNIDNDISYTLPVSDEINPNPKILSEEQKEFIDKIKWICIPYKLYTEEIEKYLSRMLKNNLPIRLPERFKSKNISFDKSLIDQFNIILKQYWYSEFNIPQISENSVCSINKIEQNTVEDLEIVFDNVEKINTIESIENILLYLKDKFNCTFDEKSLLKQYQLLQWVHQKDFIATINKAILNRSLRHLKYNYIWKIYYQRLSFFTSYRFALEKDSWRVFLWSHSEYEKWLKLA